MRRPNHGQRFISGFCISSLIVFLAIGVADFLDGITRISAWPALGACAGYLLILYVIGWLAEKP